MPKIVYKRLVILVLLFAFNANTYPSQPITNSIENKQYTNNDGISHITTSSIFQDSRGYMWFGTYNGLNKYDGYYFTTYQHIEDQKRSLSGNMVASITEDSLGNLWVATMNGLNKYDYSKDHFTRYFSEANDTNSLSDNRIAYVYTDNFGFIWVCTYNGLCKYIPEIDGFQRFTRKPLDSTSISADVVASIFQDSRGSYWVGTFGGGLNKFNDKTGEFSQVKSINSEESFGQELNVKVIVEGLEEDLWVGTWNNGLYRLDLQTNKFYPSAIKMGDIEKGITSLYLDNKRLLIGTWNGGVLEYNLESYKTSKFTSDPENPNSLSHNRVISIYKDKSKNLWVGTRKGLNKIRKRENYFNNYTRIGSDELSGLNTNEVNRIFEDKQGNIWFIKPDSRMLVSLDLLSGIFKNYYLPEPVFGDEGYVVIEACISGKSEHYINVLTSHSLLLLNTLTGDFQKVPQLTEYSKVDHVEFKSILFGSNNDLWITDTEGNLIRYNEVSKKVNTYELHAMLSDKNKNFDTYSILEDSKGIIWISARFIGIFTFDPETKEIGYINSNNSNLSSSDAIYIMEDSKSNIWIGTVNGIDLYDRVNKTFRHYELLKNNKMVSVRGILEDSAGHFWLSTGNGLVKFLPNNGRYKFYTKSDGVTNIKFNSGACLKAEDSTFYFGGLDGVTVFSPDKIKLDQNIPQLAITEFRIFNKVVQVEEKDNSGRILLKKHISETKTLELDYKPKLYSFQFAVLDYKNSKENTYAYKLEGFDSDWHYLSNINQASYASLPAGNYTFRVIGANSDGIWNTEGASIHIKIKPPYWRTWWFRIILISSVSGIFLLFYFVRMKAAKQQQRQLEHLVNERTKDLTSSNNKLNKYALELNDHRNHLTRMVEERTKDLNAAKNAAQKADRLKTAFLANMSHEIRTPMNAIIGFVDLIDDPDLTFEERENYKNLINNNSHTLLHLIDDILNISKIEVGDVHINKTVFYVDEILKEFLLNYKRQIKSLGLDVEIEYKKDRDTVLVNSDKIRFRQILDNLLNNAIKFTTEGKVEFGYYVDKSNVVFYVKDTGIGIMENNLKDIFTPFRKIDDDNSKLYRGAGLGLAICKKLIHVLNGRIWVESTFQKGSAFYFSLPHVNISKDEIVENNSHIKQPEIELRNKKILVVEDEKDNSFVIEVLLKASGVNILHAENGVEAIKSFNDNADLDLILMDIKMPVMDGFTASKEIRKINSKIPIIATTAYTVTNIKEKCLMHGCNDILLKPIKKDDLLKCLYRHIS